MAFPADMMCSGKSAAAAGGGGTGRPGGSPAGNNNDYIMDKIIITRVAKQGWMKGNAAIVKQI